MAKRAEPKSDPSLDEALHPRRTLTLSGQGRALDIVSRAIRAGRPPQAWLMCGPPGIGKATLGYRIARYLLAYGATAEGPADLAVPEDHPDARLVAAGSHPGLLVLRRGLNPDTGKPMTVLGVDQVRKLGSFFGMTAGAGGWRVVLIDAVDDMNDAAANALLKLLEEPPAAAMLLLVCHAPGRMLPTIRSRCQRLDLRPLGAYDMETELARLIPDMAADERARLAALAGGSPGAALQLAGDGMMLAEAADKLVSTAADPDIPALMGLMEKVARLADGPSMLGDFVLQVLMDRIRVRAAAGQNPMNRWAEAYETLGRLFARTEALHLDPRQTMLSAVAAMGAAARRSGAL